MKQRPEHIPFLDYLRGLAILSVFVFHSLLPSFGILQPRWTGWFRDWHLAGSFFLIFPAAYGWAGVPIFFAISGFCIHLSHQRSRHKGYKVFFTRRFFRIYPPYLLALCLATIVYLGTQQNTLSAAISQFVSHFFLVHNFGDNLFFGINPSLWSIAVEVQLYLLYPLLLWLAAGLGWQRALWITALFEVGLRSLEGILRIPYPSWDLPRFYTGSPLYYWFSWAMGAALADAYLKGQPLPFRNFLGFVWPLLFLASYFFKPLFPYGFTLATLSATCLIAYGLSRPTLHLPSKGWPGYAFEHLRRAGVVSYSAYLIHQPLLNEIPAIVSLIFPHRVFPPLVMYGVCLCSWLPIFGLSYLFYKYVEQPSIAWGKLIIDRQRQKISGGETLKPNPVA